MASWTPFGAPEQTYFATGTIAASVSGKAFFEIRGSATKQINIKRILIGSGAAAVLTVNRHTTALLTSSPTAVTPAALVSSNASATATAALKTASAATQAGTTLFYFRSFAGFPQKIDFGAAAGQELILSGTADYINFACNAATDWDITVIFSEV